MRIHIRHGFTLIELLVVVTIIVVLLTILTPALDKAFEAAHRAICAANLHTTHFGLVDFALDHKRVMPPFTSSYKQQTSHGVYPVWLSRRHAQGTLAAGAENYWEEDPYYGMYRGHGIAADKKYVNPKSFYCPSNRDPAGQYDQKIDQAQNLGEIYVQEHRGGWPSGDNPEERGWRQIDTNYHYHNFGGPTGTPAWRPPSLREPSSKAFMADHFSGASGRGVDQHHLVGYNVLRLDGSVAFFSDPEFLIRDINAGRGYTNQENTHKRVFDEYFK